MIGRTHCSSSGLAISELRVLSANRCGGFWAASVYTFLAQYFDGTRLEDRMNPEHVSAPCHVVGRVRLDERERLALTVLGRRYLRFEPQPAPLTWEETTRVLAGVDPDQGWNAASLQALVDRTGQRLFGSSPGQGGEEGSGRAVHQLFHALLLAAVLVPTDLRLLD